MGAYGRVWGHLVGSEVVVGSQAHSIDRDMWQGWDGVVRCGACSMVYGHVAGLVAGCGGMWQGLGCLVACSRGGGMWQGMGACHKGYGYMAGGRVETCGRGWGHVAGGCSMWQGVGSCGRGWGHVAWG